MHSFVVFLVVFAATEAAIYRSKIRHVKTPRNLIPKSKFQNPQPIHEYQTSQFTVELSIGTPPQQFLTWLILESDDVWVGGRNCTTPACNGEPWSNYRKHHFDERNSSSFRTYGTLFSVFEPYGFVNGLVGFDKFQLSGISAENVLFVVASELESYFGDVMMDGALGLGLPARFIKSMADRLDQAMFTIWLKDEEYADGVLTFGATDKEHCDAAVRWLPVATPNNWHFTITGLSVGSYTVKKDQIGFVILNEQLMSGPIEQVAEIARRANATISESPYTAPCSARYTAPDIVFNIGGMAYVLPATEYIQDLYDWGNDRCMFMIHSAYPGDYDWSFDSRFMRKICMSFDVAAQKIGFARAK